MSGPGVAMDVPQGHWGALAQLLAPFRRQLAVLGVISAAGALLPLAGPLLVRSFIDRAIAGDPTSELVRPAVAYVVIAVVAQVVAMVVLWMAMRLTWRVTDNARVELTDHILRHDLQFHQHHTPGELVERVDGDLTAVSEHLASFAITIVRVGLTVTGMVVVTAVIDWRLALVLGIYVAVSGRAFLAIRDRAVADSAMERGAMAQLYGGIEERLAGIDDLRGNGAGAHAMDSFEHDGRQLMEAVLDRERATIWLWHGATGAVIGGTMVALILGAAGTSFGWISVGTAFLLFQYMQLLHLPLEEIVEELQEVQTAAGAILRVRLLLDEQPPVPPASGPVMPEGAVAVSFTGVRFCYGDEQVLTGVNLTLDAGQSLGIVGATGGGKTTLGRLLTRTIAPDAGVIHLGSIDLADIAESDLRHTMGVVPQDVEIFNATVRDNVSLFDPTASDAAICNALERVGLAPKLLRRPEGLDHFLAGDGGGLSAGEQQLLALSRVFLRDPSVVLLDEATSRVDPESEQLVLDAIGELLEGRTAVVIAHRLATLERVDQIAVLRNGTIAEHGDRLALLGDDSIYARLVALTAAPESSAS